MNVSLPTVKYADAQKQIAFFDELLRRVSALPGVRSAAISAALPLVPKRITPMLPEGQPEVPLAAASVHRSLRPSARVVPDHARSAAGRAGIYRCRQSRGAEGADRESDAGAPLLAEREPDRQAHCGGPPAAPSEVVGVAADVKNRGLALDPQPQIYFPFPQIPWGNMNLLVRTATDPHAMVSAVRAQISALDSDQPVTNIQTVDELMDGSRAQPRFILLLLGVFSAAALVLAIIGIYGVLAYSVAQRRQELGIRLALGAEKSDILRLVVGYGLTLAAAGIVDWPCRALALSWIMASVLSGVLYKISARDLTTFVRGAGGVPGDRSVGQLPARTPGHAGGPE